MTWEETVESKREPLLTVVLGLIAAIGLEEGVSIDRISKPLHRKVLRLLRTAESAVRRLIVAAARNIVVEPEPEHERPASVKEKVSSTDTAKADVRSSTEAQAPPLVQPVRRAQAPWTAPAQKEPPWS